MRETVLNSNERRSGHNLVSALAVIGSVGWTLTALGQNALYADNAPEVVNSILFTTALVAGHVMRHQKGYSSDKSFNETDALGLLTLGAGTLLSYASESIGGSVTTIGKGLVMGTTLVPYLGEQVARVLQHPASRVLNAEMQGIVAQDRQENRNR